MNSNNNSNDNFYANFENNDNSANNLPNKPQENSNINNNQIVSNNYDNNNYSNINNNNNIYNNINQSSNIDVNNTLNQVNKPVQNMSMNQFEENGNQNINNYSDNNQIDKKMTKRKKIFRVLFIFLMLFVTSSLTILVLAEFKIIKLPWLDYPEVLTLSQNEVTLKKDTNFQFSTYVYPSQVNYGKVIFESSDPTVADVNPITGYVETKKNGVATIKAYLEDYHDISDVCEVVVSNSNVTIESVRPEGENINIMVGNTHMLKYEYYPKNAGIHFFVYNSSDPSIISVNNKGEVTALKEGKAVINIIDEVSGNSTYQEFTVYKGKLESDNKNMSSDIKLSTDRIDLSIGGEFQTNSIIDAIDEDKSISLSVVNNDVATITDDGIIKAVDYGKTQIIVTALDGTNKIIDIEVKEEEIPMSNIKINGNLSINIGDSKRASITIEPNNATDQTIIWSIADENIAKVDNNGKVTGISAGKTTLKATASDGNLVSEVMVTVNKPVNTISVNDLKLSHSSVTLNDGSSINVTATISPSNATNKKITWASSDKNIATVSDGMIYAKSPGTTYVTATTNNNISKRIMVVVNPIIVNSITLNETNVKIGNGGEIKLYVNFNPSKASNKSLTWTSSNTNVATVKNGTVSTHNIGTATITAKSINGKTATCIITVTNEKIKVTSLSLNSSQYIVKANGVVGITPIINPSNATDQKITYSINNPSIATVGSDGTIKGIKEGVVTLTAKTSNGKTATAFVLVKNKNSSVNYLDGKNIKYWYDNSYGTYAITHIWVKNASSQFKTELPDKFGTLANPYTLTQKAAKKNSGKTLISINASGYVNESFSPALYKINKNWKNTSVSPIVIYEGRVMRDFTTINLQSTSHKIYTINGNGDLTHYPYDINKDKNTGLAQKMLNDGVKYTFGFSPVLVKNSTAQSGLSTQNNIRQSICQIDSNNFLYISNITSNRSKGFSPNSLAKKMAELGCKTGYNLDGGGSTSVYYVKKGANKPTKIIAMEGTYGRSIPDIIYFVGD